MLSSKHRHYFVDISTGTRAADTTTTTTTARTPETTSQRSGGPRTLDVFNHGTTLHLIQKRHVQALKNYFLKLRLSKKILAT